MPQTRPLQPVPPTYQPAQPVPPLQESGCNCDFTLEFASIDEKLERIKSILDGKKSCECNDNEHQVPQVPQVPSTPIYNPPEVEETRVSSEDLSELIKQAVCHALEECFTGKLSDEIDKSREKEFLDLDLKLDLKLDVFKDDIGDKIDSIDNNINEELKSFISSEVDRAVKLLSTKASVDPKGDRKNPLWIYVTSKGCDYCKEADDIVDRLIEQGWNFRMVELDPTEVRSIHQIPRLAHFPTGVQYRGIERVVGYLNYLKELK